MVTGMSSGHCPLKRCLLYYLYKFSFKNPSPKRKRKSPKSPKIPPNWSILDWSCYPLVTAGVSTSWCRALRWTSESGRPVEARQPSESQIMWRRRNVFSEKGSKRTQRERSEKRRPIFADFKGKILSQKNSLRDLEVKESKVWPKTMQSAGQRG